MKHKAKPSLFDLGEITDVKIYEAFKIEQSKAKNG